MLRPLFFLSCLTTSLFAAPVSLFDGKTLEHFEGNAALWKVVNGEIHGGSLTEQVKQNDFLATKKSFSNFELKLKLRLTGTGFVNSGVQIRSVRVPGNSEMSGYQVDYGPGWYGKLYDESRRNKVIADSVDPKAVAAGIKAEDWNEYVIRAEGPRIKTWINGVAALDYTEADANIAQDGHIGIQIHSGGKAVIQAKDITIEELPATPDAPTWDKVGRPGAKKPKSAAAKPDAAGQTKTQKVGAQTRIAGGPLTPEEQLATFKLPEGLEMELVAAEIPEEGIGKFVAVYFDQKGAMWTMTALEYPVDGNENAAAADALYKSRAKDKILVYDRDPKSPTGFVSKPRVFADGLAIPLGILPYKDGCYALHGHDIIFLRDTDGDGKADKREVILTGMGVQDSHLFPHQFTRAPGGWIWMAQGLFNNSKVMKPGDDKAVEWKKCSMAKMRPDGSEFEVTSTGPNNIWGLAMNAEGETFIQEANDYGYSVMPFHEYAYYPGGMEALRKSYQPSFPPQADFLMGGTGLSGLAFTDKDGIYPDGWRDMMLVANPITNRVQTIKMLRDGPRWKLEQRPDIVQTTDSWFRPVGLTLAPDGCVYIVDWYNKIISHNEVARNHPDRDKTRGRIFRIKPKGKPLMEVPDFTKLSGDELISKLGGASLAQHHLAWQAIVDRGMKELAPKLQNVITNGNNDAARIGAIWCLDSLSQDALFVELEPSVFLRGNRNVQREFARALGDTAIGSIPGEIFFRNAGTFAKLAKSSLDSEVRAALITACAKLELRASLTSTWDIAKLSKELFLPLLLSFAKEPISGPTAKAAQGKKLIKVGEAYERDYERFLIRMFLEQQPWTVAEFLDSDAAKNLPVEARLLASLSLEPKASAPRVAALLPQLTRPPEKDEILRLVQYLDEPGVTEAVKATLGNPTTAPAVLASLLELRTKLDPAKLSPLVADAATKLLASKDAAQIESGVKLAGAFKIMSAEPALVALTGSDKSALLALRALGELGSAKAELFEKLVVESKDPLVRDEALSALAASKAADAPQRVLALYPKLAPAQRRLALDKLTTNKAGAAAVVASPAVKGDIDAATLDRLLAVLGDKDAALNTLVESLGTLFRPVLAFDGSDNTAIETGLTLEGAFTVETWVKLDEEIGNADSILGAPGQLDLNFYGGQLRVYAFPPLGDLVAAKKPTIAGMWQHIAAARDAEGKWKIYLDGELSATSEKKAPVKIENARIAWSSAPGGLKGQLAEFRIWKSERTAEEIRGSFDRAIELNKGTPTSLLMSISSSKSIASLKLPAGAKAVRTSDLPPVLTAEAAAKLDADFTKYRALAGKPGDKERGKAAAAICQACHLFGNAGGQIGPNLSGIGAMGTEAILRNILTPNAAMESGYRIFRVEQKDGSVLDAFFVSEDKDAVVIRMPGGADQRIPKKNITKTSYLHRSLMPEGLLAGMSDQQVSDLFAYLLSLK